MRRQRIIGPSFPFLVTPISAGGGAGMPSLKTGLYAFWEFESGATMVDSSVNAIPLTNGTVLGGFSDVTSVSGGIKGNCGSWNSGVACALASNVPIFSNSLPFSWVIWIKFGAAIVGAPFCLYNGDFNISVATGNIYWSIGGTFANVLTGALLPASWPTADSTTWYMIYAEYDGAGGTTVRLNNSGTFAQFIGGQTFTPSGANIQIPQGGSSFSSQVWMDQIAGWSRVLTTGEQDWLYNSGLGRAYSEM